MVLFLDSGLRLVMHYYPQIPFNTQVKVSKTLYQFKRYAGPIIHFLNETNVPMFTISEDPRHIQLKANK